MVRWRVVDVTGRTNLAGAGLNMARRDGLRRRGHILLSKHIAEDLAELRNGDVTTRSGHEVKHGMQVAIVNLWSDDVGNRQLPKSFKLSKTARPSAGPKSAAAFTCRHRSCFCSRFKKSAKSTSIVPEKSIAVLPSKTVARNVTLILQRASG